MRGLGEAIVLVVFIGAWLAGIVIAKGFWSALFACVMPFWAWYLFVELAMKHAGML